MGKMTWRLCFGFTRKDIHKGIEESGQSTFPTRIGQAVKAGKCACEVKNPSGKCCLGGVARTAKEALGRRGRE